MAAHQETFPVSRRQDQLPPWETIGQEQVPASTRMAVKGAKALEVWARRVTDGYPNVRVRDMSRSWKDGLAFCAILHKFRPDLLDFYSLDQSQIER